MRIARSNFEFGFTTSTGGCSFSICIFPMSICAAAFDLVSCQYFPLPRRPGHVALRALLDAVAPGGTLLFVGHDLADLPERVAGGLVPRDFYQPDEIAGHLRCGWDIEVNEIRARTAPAPEGTGHVRDAVLRARRLPAT